MPATSHDSLLGEPRLRVSADALAATTVTPDLGEPHDGAKNLLYCSTFQLAWRKLGEKLGGPVRVEGGSPLVTRLDESCDVAADLDDASYVACAGSVEEGILDRIRAELARKFGGAASPALPANLLPGSLIAYAYLFKNLAFETPLASEPQGLPFAGVYVDCFGIWSDPDRAAWRKRAKQVTVLHYGDEDDFVLEIAAGDGGDRLLIARAAPGRTLGDTVAAIVERSKTSMLHALSSASKLAPEEELRVPCMHFDITRSYPEVSGRLLNPAAQGRRIDLAMQSIHFRLDERGAMLKSEARIVALGMARKKPRRFVCDGPFAVLMMRKNAKRPYFALWVQNAELLAAAPS